MPLKPYIFMFRLFWMVTLMARISIKNCIALEAVTVFSEERL